MTNDAAVAWYYEFGDTGEAGPVTFGGDPGREAIEWAERYGHTLHYLVPATTVAELRARVAELEAVLRPLADATFAEFCGVGTEAYELDDAKVSYPEDDCNITFGMIRNARAALTKESP